MPEILLRRPARSGFDPGGAAYSGLQLGVARSLCVPPLCSLFLRGEALLYIHPPLAITTARSGQQ